MAKINVNKTEAARRQIDTAIRLLFSGEDPVAIHTLAGAAFRILRDLAGKKTDSYMKKITQAMIKPGMESKFWRQWNTSINFLKHADKDPNSMLENVDEEVNEGILFIASLYYQDLGHRLTPEMITLVGWYTAMHPEFLREDASATFTQAALQSGTCLIDKSRAEQLAIGSQLLQLARSLSQQF